MGIGAAVGAAVGAGIGLASGGGLSGALEGAALGGIGGGALGAATGIATIGDASAALGGATDAASGIGSGLTGDFASGLGVSGTGALTGTASDFASGLGVTDTLGASGAATLASEAGTGTGLVSEALAGGAGASSGGLGLGTAGLLGQGINAAGQIIGSQTAAQAQKQSAQQAIAAQKGYFDTTQQALYPFIATGQGAAGQLANLEGANGPSAIQSTLQSLPGYQFANYQGLKSTQNSATARGLGVSGAADKGAAAYSTGLANEYYNNLLTGLQNTESIGSGAASSLGTAATQTGSLIGENLVGAGTAQGAANVATGNAAGSIGSTIPNTLLLSSLLQSQNGGNNANSGIFSNPWAPF